MLLTVCCMLIALKAAEGGAHFKGVPAGYNLGTFGGELPNAVKVIRVTNTVAVPVPYPYPVTKHVPVPVSVPKPIPYAVPQPVPVEVTKPVVISQPIPFHIPKPYTVPQPFPVKTHQLPFPLHLQEYLTAPQYQGNQAADYQAYVAYGGAGNSDYSGTAFGQEQSYQAQQGFNYEGSQGGFGNSAPEGYAAMGQAQAGYGNTAQEGYAAVGQAQAGYGDPGQGDYPNMQAGATGYGESPGVSQGQNFETTNSLEEQHPVATSQGMAY